MIPWSAEVKVDAETSKDNQPHSKEAKGDIWWFICTLCNRAFIVNGQLTELQEHKWVDHGSRDVDNLLILSQSISLESKVKMVHCSLAQLPNCSTPSRSNSTRKEDMFPGGGGAIKREIEDEMRRLPAEETESQPNWSSVNGPPSPQLSDAELPAAVYHEDKTGQVKSTTTVEAQCSKPTEEHGGRKLRQRLKLKANFDCDPEHIRLKSKDPRQGQIQKSKISKAKATLEGRPRCPICPKDFSLRSSLQFHMRRTHGEGRPLDVQVCDECGRTFKSLQDLRSHTRVHDPLRTASHRCPICARPFFTEGALRMHKVSHEERKFMCSDCGVLFTTKRSLQYHQKSLHSEERPFACDKCPLLFKQKKTLLNHAARHAAEAHFVCTQCPKAYKTKQDLRNHTRRTHETKIRNCRVCALECKGLVSLRRHEMEAHGFHRAKTWYECKHEGCSAKFPTKATFENHLASHTDKRSIKCPDCDKQFKTKVHLLQHSVSHVPYDQLPHVCHVCGKRSGFPGHLRQHRRNVHGIQ